MKETPFRREREAAINAVREAAELCRRVRRQMEDGVLEKDDRTPVTVADFGSQALICRRLQTAFPDDPVMGEEDASSLRAEENGPLLHQVVRHAQSVRNETTAEEVCAWIDHGSASSYADRFWTLDPIDGTKGFIRGDQYAIALALLVEGEPVVAALGCPNLAAERAEAGDGVVLVAERGEGAWQLPIQGSQMEGRRIEVSSTRSAAEARFCESFVSAHSSHEVASDVGRRLDITREPLRVDSQVKYGVVARGEVEIYMRLPRGGYVEKIWDHAAGKLILEAAGGKITDMEGRPLSFRHGRRLEENRGIVATNSILHEDVLEALAAATAQTS